MKGYGSHGKAGCATSGTKTSQATVKRVASGKLETAKPARGK